MKVLMLSMEWTPNVSGGVGTHVYELASGLAKEGTEVVVFAYTPTEPRVIEAENLRVHLIAPSAESFQEAAQGSLVRGILAFNQDLERVLGPEIERSRPDLIHFHQWHTQEAARSCAQRYGIPVLGSCHHLTHPAERWWGQEPEPDILSQERRLFDGGVELITVSRSMQRLITEHHGLSDTAIHVVHCALDVEAFLSAKVSDAQVERLRSTMAGPDDRVVLYVGRIHPQKGIEAIFRSARTVLADLPSVKFLLVGGTDSRASTEMIASLRAEYEDIAKSIKVLGKVPRPQLPLLHRLADVALVPSIYEPFGYTAIEAMASALPLVASEAGGLSEIVIPEQTGLLVPVEGGALHEPRRVDAEALAASQLRLLRDLELARAYGAAGRRRVVETFTYANMVQETLSVYEAVKDRAVRSPPPAPVTPRPRQPSPSWIVRPVPRPRAATRLVCFHSAGAGASLFSPWFRAAPPELEVSALQLPGREDRYREAPIESFDEVLNRAYPHVREIVEEGPYAFFGHSMGALLAFELAARLRQEGYPLPSALFVASSAAPHEVRYDERDMDVDERIREELRRHQVEPDEQILDELVSVLRKTLEGDLRAFASYRKRPVEALPLPIFAYRGEDDYLVEAHARAWRLHTSRGFRFQPFAGGHFFIKEHPQLLFDDVREQLIGGVAARAQ